ncbi:mRNA-degrading endonuclease RelE of RelBE toxin-antitoxin system [Dyadobacter jejuensis]|uniref:mRNA-degrading endonuclease RelE of RelBE toxin-antitoxin system n=1 Tax=Dyadobacter jejuensis TaxID=1082580 RepID=A0A316AEW9_9BACT|nr:hypothetical protein [Dyadobacter jejuensis]PWJ55530.1 mRNA-degrading endonuclease RelE of RelBE toxin-antitoxin system [Dyadobacter jejuensis]
MKYSILLTERFKREFKRLAKKFPSLKNELLELGQEIIANPEHGTFIGNNCYKIRLAIASKGKGKRGGAMVITYCYVQTETVYLLTIYDKGEKVDLEPSELKEMINSLEL